MADFNTEEVSYLANHLFLPPQLPQETDSALSFDNALIRLTKLSLKQLGKLVPSDQALAFAHVSFAISKIVDIRDGDGAVDGPKLVKAFQNLDGENDGASIPLYIESQNAGVILTKNGQSIDIETMELSPVNSSVMSTTGRLRRCFPGSGLRVEIEQFRNANLQTVLSNSLSKMSSQRTKTMTPTVKKAGQDIGEIRDTTDPGLVTELVLSFLQPLSNPSAHHRIWKNTREDVLWKNSLLPWRRSPLWLFIRVVMHVLFTRHLMPDNGGSRAYKLSVLYAHAMVLNMALHLPHHTKSDMLHCMKAKIVHRMVKLDLSDDEPGIHFVKKTINEATRELEERWAKIQQHDAKPLDINSLRSLQYEKDVALALPDLDMFLFLLDRSDENRYGIDVALETGLQTHAAIDSLPKIDVSCEKYLIYNLASFERWVAKNLAAWLADNDQTPQTCASIRTSMSDYYSAANSEYFGNPEAMSIMTLTLLELWIACDQCAGNLVPMLGDYYPEIPTRILQSMVLPAKDQMARLLRVEKYLENRRKAATRGKGSSIFHDFGNDKCFSVRFFNQSPMHQKLKERIEVAANKQRDQKRTELAKKKQKYERLIQQSSNEVCKFVEVQNRRGAVYHVHAHSCKKCKLQKEAQDLDIDVHEWPLPSRQMEAKSVVFELDAPPTFVAWRDATVFLLHSVLGCEYTKQDKPEFKYALSTYAGLQQYFEGDRNRRIGLLSEIKPHNATHRNVVRVSQATESMVLLDNGLRFRYHDSVLDCFISRFQISDAISQWCTYSLPSASSSLNQFIWRRFSGQDAAPNTTISSQSECPQHMSLAEYRHLTSIPVGPRLQWMNILVQLVCPSIDLRKQETSLLLYQAIFQAGPPSPDGDEFRRDAHGILADVVFGDRLLDAVDEASHRIESNWESLYALGILVSIGARLLAINTSRTLRERAFKVLSGLREIALRWARLLRNKLGGLNDNSQRSELLAKVVDVSLVCCGTFDMNDGDLREVLSNSRDAAVLIECNIVIHEYYMAIARSSCDILYKIIYRRWQQVSYRSYSMIAEIILHRPEVTCLDEALSCFWSGYKRGTLWESALDTADTRSVYWATTTSLAANEQSLAVHYNLLTGQLLVNGSPLSRLPDKYSQHKSYQELFGLNVFETVPSSVPGMQFTSKQAYIGFVLHFGLQGSDLLVQAAKDDQCWELVPRRLFNGKLPTTFVEDYFHWYDVSSKTVLFHQKHDAWNTTADTWKMTQIGSAWILGRQGTRLINPKSLTGKAISGIMAPLQPSLRVNIFLSNDDNQLEIKLPQLQLAFQLQRGKSEVLSRQLRGFEVDEQQSIGTLIGLANKLVMRNQSTQERRLIVPMGQVHYSRASSHVSVHITPGRSTSVFKVDNILKKLSDNGDLQSKLFLSYLHGLTSFCLPDPFTCFTGTEQALSILRSAAVRSFQVLTSDNLKILRSIEALTPRRHYYPKNVQVMQTVSWDEQLPVMSQHPFFHLSVMDIFQQSELTKLYYPEEYVALPEIQAPQKSLLVRDICRTAAFRISGFGAEGSPDSLDVIYVSRDNVQCSSRAIRAQTMSTALFNGSSDLPQQLSSGQGLAANILRLLGSENSIKGPGIHSHNLKSSELDYDGRWLEDHSVHWANLWCRMHQKAQKTEPVSQEPFHLMMWFSTMAFAAKADMDMIVTAAAMFLVPEVREIEIPQMTQTRICDGAKLDVHLLEQTMRSSFLHLEQCPDSDIWHMTGESYSDRAVRMSNAKQRDQDQAAKKLLDHLSAQWPCPVPLGPVGRAHAYIQKYIDLKEFMEGVIPTFRLWYRNWEFVEYIKKIASVINRQSIRPLELLNLSFNPPYYEDHPKKAFMNTCDLLASLPQAVPPEGPKLGLQMLLIPLKAKLEYSVENTTARERFELLLHELDGRANTAFETSYTEELNKSANQLHTDAGLQKTDLCITQDSLSSRLEDHLARSKTHAREIYHRILSIMSSGLGRNQFAWTCYHTPRPSPVWLLQQLCRRGGTQSAGWHKVPRAWRPFIIAYALALTEVQRAKRLLRSRHNPNDLIRELQNEGHTNWKPTKHPESLLLEVESGIMIREVQEDIARQMRHPPEMKNSSMQLNMGEGKSSVIVPLVAAAMANGSRLVRVVVAKPQSRQMFHMLVCKIGGLLNRRVFHLPFSRSICLTSSQAKAIHEEVMLCMRTSGIMLVQPEHILSFKLMGLESLITGKESIGSCLLETQHFFDTNSRDIIDESDENFSVKFELIYTMGTQRSVEFSPERWIVIQCVLTIMAEHAIKVRDTLPNSIEVHERHIGSFPRIRLLQQDAISMLLNLVARQLCTNGLPGFPSFRLDDQAREAVFKYITQPDLSREEIERVERGRFWTETTSSFLLLLRGLFAGGVLGFAFGQKRWRVNYGLDDTRRPPTELAVPYRAKDSPTPRSEFSHPDVIILLTCNCYYYGGLKDDHLFLAFSHLIDSDQADANYENWVQDSKDLPKAFRQLMGVNLKDTFQCRTKIFPSFRYAKSTVDYFLQSIVFPKKMKEFPQKLSASGWDLGDAKVHPVTGFSGTVDSNKLLPLDVTYLDLSEQKHTNAKVLLYLLRPENGVILLPSTSRIDATTTSTDKAPTSSSDAEALLEVILGEGDPNLRVILDVGAQILELTNHQVAAKWLAMAHAQDPGVQAAIYFNDNEEIMVLDREGHIEALWTSPYDEQLDLCVVYLDEAHTRGTDLRLPETYRAAVTLGANLTKDRLVQACMRMRKLGHGQSVVFCIPHEIQTKIWNRHVGPRQEIGVSEVLSWAIGETHNDLRKSMPLWAVQGQRFERQKAVWDQTRDKLEISMTVSEATSLLEEEAQPLERRYRPRKTAKTAPVQGADDNVRLRRIQERCREVGSLNFDQTSLQEEQERELSPEIEEERQLERPPPAMPATHLVHPDVTEFVSTGRIIRNSRAFMPAFTALMDTSAAKHLDVFLFPKDVMVTADFAKTVKKSAVGGFTSDAYQRPVQWILSTQPQSWEHVVVISPYEAQELLPVISKGSATTLHVYSPRPNQEIRPLDTLDLYTVPSSRVEQVSSVPLLYRVQLNLFAGQLYFKSFEEYAELCRICRLSCKQGSDGTDIAGDGFILSSTSEEWCAIIRDSSFSKSPVKFLKAFLSRARRDCQPIEKTHLGKILDGALLNERDFGPVEHWT